MAATTFMTGEASPPPPEPPPLVAGLRVSLAEGLRLLRTPSSEAGVLAYHRALEGGPPSPLLLLEELAELRSGRATRLELLAMIATSPKARERGVGGSGILLIRLVRKAFRLSGAARRIKARRALAAQADHAEPGVESRLSTSADVGRRLVVMEGALLRLEDRLFAAARPSIAQVAALEERVAVLEAELKRRILGVPDSSEL